MRSCIRIVALVLCLLACMAMLTPVLAAPADQDCARNAKYPNAQFTCVFAEPATRGSSLPEGLPIAVNCYDQSDSDQAIASWKWDFGDGGTSTRQSPSHSYAEAGAYQISLTVTTICGGSYTDTTTDGMDVYCIVPEPYFTVDVDKGAAPLTVHVRDGSYFAPEGVTRWTYWLDSTHRSTDRNPVYVYTKPGIYTISLTLSKECVRPGLRAFPPYEQKINVTPAQISLLYMMNFSNATTTAIPATTGAPLWLNTPYAINTGSRPATTTVTTIPVTVAAVTPQADPASAGTMTLSGTGTLAVATDPSGAKVYVDDVLRGASPATVPNLEAGAHMLRLEREGYRNMTVPVDISNGKTTAYSTALVPESSGGMGILPLIIGAVVVIALAGIGGYVYMKKGKAP